MIQLSDQKVVGRVSVGTGAHHLAFSPDARQAWVALWESAHTIAIVSTIVGALPPPPQSPLLDPAHPHVIGRFDPGFAAHDLAFSPNGRRVCIASASGPVLGVFDAHDRRALFRVPVGPPPQHLAFAGRYAYITSGYGATIEKVDAATGQALKRAAAPNGSFELDATDGSSSPPR